MQTSTINLVECPRDAMQGWPDLISTEKKIEYLTALLKVGFHTLDCGSFVSPKAIPQMADTRKVLQALQASAAFTDTRVLTIVANLRGAEEAVAVEAVDYIGFPLSVSETFQQRNANSSVAASFDRLREIQQLCVARDKQLVVYLSMAFGNPYNDPYSPEIVFEWADKVAALGVKIISLADTVGLASPEHVAAVTAVVVKQLPQHEIGVHLHSSSSHWKPKLDAAVQAGCSRIDGALKGIGGCPMAGDSLVGNLDTALIIPYLEQRKLMAPIDKPALEQALLLASEIFV